MTEQDRWWLAYCLLGAALVLRAPTIYWAVVVVVVWGVLLTVMSLRAVRQFVFGSAAVKPEPVTDVTERESGHWPESHWPHRPLVPHATATEVTERLAVIPTVPPAQATPRFAEDDTIVLPDGAATAEMQPSGRVLVNLQGTVWTTETMLVAILDAIGQARGRGENEL